MFLAATWEGLLPRKGLHLLPPPPSWWWRAGTSLCRLRGARGVCLPSSAVPGSALAARDQLGWGYLHPRKWPTLRSGAVFSQPAVSPLFRGRARLPGPSPVSPLQASGSLLSEETRTIRTAPRSLRGCRGAPGQTPVLSLTRPHLSGTCFCFCACSMSDNDTHISDCDERMKDPQRPGTGTVMATRGSSVDVLKVLRKT